MLISFDLDGTLVDYTQFDMLFWYEEVPKLYAIKHKLSFEEAKKQVIAEYDRVGSSNINWYNPSFWFKHFSFLVSHKKIIGDMKKNIVLFNDVIPALSRLKKNNTLIILTHSSHEFNEFKLEAEGLKGMFSKIISTTSDLHVTKKSEKVYQMISDEFGISPKEIIHIGDDYEFDYQAPRRIGIRAFYLDRSGKKKGEDIVSSLLDFEKALGASFP